MAMEILKDSRVRSVEWRDLCELKRWDVVHELIISAPWLILSLVLAFYQYWFFASAASFMFFLCGLRQAHNAYHYAIGISVRAHEVLIFLLSMVMLTSLHAVQFNHLRHHRYCMEDKDVEATSATMRWWRAILYGPRFTYLLQKTAYTEGSTTLRKWMLAEWSGNIVSIILITLVFDVAVLQYHLLVMIVAHCLTAFFAVWTVHHDCDKTHFIARTVRDKIKAVITYNMFFHVEHHLYPKVPTCRLHVLASRLDRVAPELQQKRVF